MKAEDTEMKQYRLMRAQQNEEYWDGRVKELRVSIRKTEKLGEMLKKKLTKVTARFDALIAKANQRKKDELADVKREISSTTAKVSDLHSTMKSAEERFAAARDAVKQAKAVLR